MQIAKLQNSKMHILNCARGVPLSGGTAAADLTSLLSLACGNLVSQKWTNVHQRDTQIVSLTIPRGIVGTKIVF